MTIQEAIDYLQPIAESAALPSYKEALGIALAALEEQKDKRTKVADENAVQEQI